MPRITVLYFAALREQRGRPREELEVAEGTTLARLYADLFPASPLGSLPAAFVRNQRHAEPDEAVADGDEIAFLPPLGGG